MPYKISGTKNETARVMVIKETDWSMESNTVISGSGAYEVTGLDSSNKIIVVESNEDEILSYGNITPISYDNKTLWVWGRNDQGQLGQGDQTERSSPTQVGVLDDWGIVRGGYIFSVNLKPDGTIWTWGAGNYGQLGLGDFLPRSSPIQVGSLTDWSSIGTGSYGCMAIKTNNTLWGWGANNFGQLGLGDRTNKASPTQCGALTDWSEVDSGDFHTITIKTDGTLWSMGRNTQGQLGLGDIVHRSSPVQVGALADWNRVSCGSDGSSYAIKTDGTLWTWGFNTQGQLGVGNTTDYSSPVQVGSDTDWDNISGGQYVSVAALRTNGTLWTWGYNDLGQLGVGDTTHRSSPTQVGSDTDWVSVHSGHKHMVAVKSNGTLWTWGNNVNGQLGQGNTTHYSSPVQVGVLTIWNTDGYIDTGGDHTLAAIG